MSELLQIEIDRMREELSVLENAIGIFREYVEGAFQNEIGYVEGMRSDFTPKLKDILEKKRAMGIYAGGMAFCYWVYAIYVVSVLR